MSERIVNWLQLCCIVLCCVVSSGVLVLGHICLVPCIPPDFFFLSFWLVLFCLEIQNDDDLQAMLVVFIRPSPVHRGVYAPIHLLVCLGLSWVRESILFINKCLHISLTICLPLCSYILSCFILFCFESCVVVFCHC
jgi:hypothetical protein